MIKRLLCILLCLVSLVSLFSFPKAEAANESVKTQLIKLYNKFPHGKYWNHVGKSNQPDGVTSTSVISRYSCGPFPRCEMRFKNFPLMSKTNID